MSTVRGVLRDDQMALLRWVLAAVDPGAPSRPRPPLPDLDLSRLQSAGIATGLTAAVGVLARDLPETWREFIADQVAAVAARRQRYASLTPIVLRALHDAGVGAVPVKGVVLADRVWPVADARPMADIDLIVRPADRERAVAALVAAGLERWNRTASEDVLLAWGDGSRGANDRESATHNGKVEVHPGWLSEVHHYTIDDGGWLLASARDGELSGVRCRMLSAAALTAHALGHLSVCTIRAEVRALNVIDVILLIAALDAADVDEFTHGCGILDPRLVAPGLWMVRATRPAWFRPAIDLDELTERQLERLPGAAAARLRSAEPGDVLREHGQRTTVRWRLAFTANVRERAGVMRQAVTPTASELAADAPGETVWRQQARRAGRAGRRLRRRLVGGRA